MKFGVNAFIWSADYGPDVQAALPLIKEHGFDGVELAIFHAHGFQAAQIRRDTEAHGLETTVCTVIPSELSLVSDDAGIRARTQRHLRDCIAGVAEAGSKLLVGPTYTPVGYLPGRRRTPQEWEWAVEGLQSLTDTLVAHDVTLAVEPLNRFETFFLNTAADAAALCDAVNHPNVGVLFDTFHANIEEKDIAAGYRTVGRHLKHVHTCENDRGTPGNGHVEWGAVFQALRDVQYDGWLTIESFGFALGGISAAASIWRDIERAPEDIAFDGIRFLKGRYNT
jgi:D-psicose/D-tagatose/L-ribulose 3-epimerase